VAASWPEYARNGKDTITIRHVLTHRTGVPFASGSEFGDALTMARWDCAVLQARDATPTGESGVALGGVQGGATHWT
jgi:CubicO group peptidase (beta-lactamase class C family)